MLQLPSASLTNVASDLAGAFLSVVGKLPSGISMDHLAWDSWQAGILKAFLEKIPNLTVTLLRHPAFATPGNERWTHLLESDYHPAAARLFLEKLQVSSDFAWSHQLVRVLSALPSSQVSPLFLRQWNRPELRNALLPILANNPVPSDREKYLWGLESEDSEAVAASLTALLKLPVDSRGETLVGAMRLLRRLLGDPEQRPWRTQIVELLKRERDFPFTTIAEPETSRSSLEQAYALVFDWFVRSRPVYAAQLDEPDGENLSQWDSTFKAVQLKIGDVARGQLIFQDRGCAGCHSGTSHLGPDLGGIHLRRSRRAVFDAVVFPNREVAPDYRATVIQMNDRTTHRGAVAHEAFDTVFIQPNATRALRLTRADIRSMHLSHRSFMPAGLLKGLDVQSLADLFAFVSSIPPEPR